MDPEDQKYNPFAKAADEGGEEKGGEQKQEQRGEEQRQQVTNDQQQTENVVAEQDNQGEENAGGDEQKKEKTHEEIIREAVQATIAAQGQQQRGAAEQHEQPKQLSDEEFRKMTNYYEATPEQLGEAFGAEFTPEQAKTFNSILQGVVKQALSTSAIYARGQVGQIQQQIHPILQQHQNSIREQQEKMFYEQHKDLAPYRDITTSVAQAMQAEIANGQAQGFSDPKEAAKALATRVRGVLKSAGLDPAKASGGGQQQNTQQNSAATKGGGPMAPLNNGGQKGGGSGGASSKNDAELIFGGKRR